MSISGKFLECAVGSMETTIAGTHEWSVAERADRLEATTGADAGRGKKDVGVVDTVIRITFYLDISSGEFVAFRAGTTLTNLKCYVDSADTDPAYLFSSAVVYDSTVRGQVRDRFIVEVEAEAYGNVITTNDPS